MYLSLYFITVHTLSCLNVPHSLAEYVTWIVVDLWTFDQPQAVTDGENLWHAVDDSSKLGTANSFKVCACANSQLLTHSKLRIVGWLWLSRVCDNKQLGLLQGKSWDSGSLFSTLAVKKMSSNCSFSPNRNCNYPMFETEISDLPKFWLWWRCRPVVVACSLLKIVNTKKIFCCSISGLR